MSAITERSNGALPRQSKAAFAEDPREARAWEAYLEVVKSSLTGALDTAVPDVGWINSRERPGFTEYVPPTARTMVGRARLDHVQRVIRELIEQGIPGDLAELGCWRGGVGMFMKACLRAYDPHGERQVWCADTFQSPEKPNSATWVQRWSGAVLAWLLPILSLKSKRAISHKVFRHNFPEEDFSEDTADALLKLLSRASGKPGLTLPNDREDVERAFRRYGLWDEKVHLLQGWFEETLPKAPIRQLALLRLDGDFYRSTRDGLRHAYDWLVMGGFCIIDDYGAFSECRRAVDEFRQERGISEPLSWIDEECVAFRKTAR